MPRLPHERLVWQHYDLPFVKPTTLQQQIGPSPRMPLLDFSSRLKLRASYSNTQISLLSLSRCSSRHCNLLTKRGIAPWTLTLTLIFLFQILGFLGRFSFRHFELCRFFCFFMNTRSDCTLVCRFPSFFRGKFCISFWGRLWPRSPQVLDSSSPSSLWFFLFSVESG